MPNRVVESFEKFRKKIDEQNHSPEKLAELNKAMDMGLDEFVKFQELKSVLMGSILTPEEAQTIYNHLGEQPSVFNGQPLHIKMTLTKLFQELLGAMIQAA